MTKMEITAAQYVNSPMTGTNSSIRATIEGQEMFVRGSREVRRRRLGKEGRKLRSLAPQQKGAEDSQERSAPKAMAELS